jgi:hypothetical protein
MRRPAGTKVFLAGQLCLLSASFQSMMLLPFVPWIALHPA